MAELAGAVRFLAGVALGALLTLVACRRTQGRGGWDAAWVELDGLRAKLAALAGQGQYWDQRLAGIRLVIERTDRALVEAQGREEELAGLLGRTRDELTVARSREAYALQQEKAKAERIQELEDWLARLGVDPLDPHLGRR